MLLAALGREERLRIAVARDLRAPVTLLQNEFELLDAGRPWADSARAMALSLRLLSDSLDQLRSGEGTRTGLSGTGAFTITDLLGWLSETFASQAKYAGVNLHFVPAQQGDVPVHGDHGRVFLALCRLIDNALTHARASDISVSGFLTRGAGQEGTLTWLVRDNGIGIDPLRQSQLFEPFGLISNARHVEARLGLFAVRRSLRMMGGDVLLEDQAADQEGCCFIVTHPVRILHQTDVVEAAGEEPVMMPARRVLLLEDDEVAAEVIAARLRLLFGRVDLIAGRDEVLSRLTRDRPDLLVLGRGSGSPSHGDLIRAIRREDRALPIVGIVPPVMPELREAMEQAGANRVLIKPVGLMQLRDLVIDLFASTADIAAPDHMIAEDHEEMESFLTDFQKVIGNG